MAHSSNSAEPDDDKTNPHDWQVLNQFVEMRSPWFTLIGEHLQDHQGQPLDYWRVERADSCIVLPLWRNQLVLPPPSYRPGVQQSTYDFPGGRVADGQSAAAIVPQILQRELGIDAHTIRSVTPIGATSTPPGFIVNSSFSNQRLYGFVAELEPTTKIPDCYIDTTYRTTNWGIAELLSKLVCLQCRALVLEWWLSRLSA
ncbi:NUDIX hydrolase [Leptolyngbya sp. AN02str]|uniref:NUDIX hydrolase n=1 Tax=Leptolyngbya sp. AN02str TaxID=3423363 RepID=UPI003D319E0A